MAPVSISASWATLARRYPLSGRRSAPTIDTARWWPTPASRSAASWLRVEVVKNSRTASSSQTGALETSTTTSAPAITSARPSPLIVSTPVAGEAGTASCPWAISRVTTLLPTRPLPPITTIFMRFLSLGLHQRRPDAASIRDTITLVRHERDRDHRIHGRHRAARRPRAARRRPPRHRRDALRARPRAARESRGARRRGRPRATARAGVDLVRVRRRRRRVARRGCAGRRRWRDDDRADGRAQRARAVRRRHRRAPLRAVHRTRQRVHAGRTGGRARRRLDRARTARRVPADALAG